MQIKNGNKSGKLKTAISAGLLLAFEAMAETRVKMEAKPAAPNINPVKNMLKFCTIFPIKII